MFKSVDNSAAIDAAKERAIVVCQLDRQAGDDNGVSPLKEITELAMSAGATVVGEMVARRDVPVAATYFGKGKAEELAAMVEELEVGLVVVDHSISPIQERNLEKILHCRVLDRSTLILDIFALRAQSREGKLQVELAQLKHLSTRLVRGWTHLERQKGGIGLRGPGETQLETDRRLLGHRMKTLSNRLRSVESQRALRRRSRHRTPIPTVSLVGYTNAGKSSLFNRLCDSGVYVADQLFATLDPTMRKLAVPGFGDVVLSDTVGFVRQLPHELVAAFHSTLEEVADAQILLLVNDVADDNHEELREAVESVLQDIDADDIPRIYVQNKIDLAGLDAQYQRAEDGLIDRVWLSAETGEGVELLLDAIASRLTTEHRWVTLKLSPAASKLRARLHQRCHVESEEYSESGETIIQVKMSPADIGWLDAQGEFSEQWQELENQAV